MILIPQFILTPTNILGVSVSQQNPQLQQLAMTEYFQWLATIPIEERTRIADMLDSQPITAFRDINELTKRLMTELMRGNISPVIADMLLRYVRVIIQTQILSEGIPVGGSMSIGGSVMGLEVQTTNKLLADVPQYHVMDAEDVEARNEKIRR